MRLYCILHLPFRTSDDSLDVHAVGSSWKRMHYTPVSDIPGNEPVYLHLQAENVSRLIISPALRLCGCTGIPEHYDYALVSALCTLPDPHNFVGVYGGTCETSDELD